MNKLHPLTLRGSFLVFLFCFAAHADDAAFELTPPFHATFEVLNTTTVAPPVAALSKLPSESALPRVTSELPQVQIRTLGPESLVVNEVARYVIDLENLSRTEARAIKVRCTLPAWVDLSDHTTTSGKLLEVTSELVWNLPFIAGEANQRLTLDLTPRAAKAFDLKFRIAAEPADAGKRIEVRQPKLALQLDGPKSVSFGQKTPWTLTVSNPGNGLLRDVQLDLFAGATKIQSQVLESIAAGSEQSIAIQLDPAQAGRQSLRVVGQSGELQDAAKSEFVVRRGELSLDIQGAAMGFAGQGLQYDVVLKNSGDDPVAGILMSLDIPNGMEYQGGLPQVDVTAGGVSWVVTKLQVGEQRSFPLSLVAQTGGMHALKLQASSVDHLAASDEIVVEAITAPDLRLVVRDPIGPRSLQGTIDYEIEVSNPGTDTARNISVIAMCDENCELLDVSGTATMKEGRIYFKPTLQLAAQHKLVFNVKVQPKVAGVLNFRVLAKSKTPETSLALQETTLVVAPLPTATEEKGGIDAIVNDASSKKDPSSLMDLSYPTDFAVPELARPQDDGSALR